MLRVIAYTGGHNAPSRVPRVQDYVEPLKDHGIALEECPSQAGLYPPLQKWRRPFWGLWNVIDRVPGVARSFRYDVSFFQREFLSTLVTWEPLTKGPRVFDVDDAIWVHRGGGFARRLARLCDHVTCGNRFLAEEFSRWNPNVSVLPTPVDTDKFQPPMKPSNGNRPIIGWMGLSKGLAYFSAIEGALVEVLRRHPGAVLRVVSDSAPRFAKIPAEQVEYIRWSAENQAALMQEMTVGIMPLENTPVCRGKCSFKMLQYMACGIPAVVTPIGMNEEVLQAGTVGLGAASEAEWESALNMLLDDAELRQRMGQAGRKLVVEQYSVKALTPRLAKTLQDVVS
jgi:glycosyltransferase involved in cell wall biosynthesis